MRARTWLFLLVMGLNLVWALSTGGRIYLLFFTVMAVMLVLALISVLLTRLTLSTECTLPEPWATRGSEVDLVVEIGHRCPLPVAPVLLTVLPPDNGPPIESRVQTPLFARAKCRQRLYCPHVGTYLVGISMVTLSDVFSLFTVRVRLREAQRALMVRPQVSELRPLRFSPGEVENYMMARATEDTTEPADTRAWQEGDPLKRVHWKLSMRRRELLVRTFEEPMRPDALVLVNCEPLPGDPETAHVLRDVLCENAASIASAQLTAGNPVRLPLIGTRTRDITTSNPMEMVRILDALAEEDFRANRQFELVMLMELRRIRRTGAVAILTASLTGNIADAAMQMRRMGPYTRLYLVHAEPLTEEQEGLLNRLEKYDIEVETIALVNDYVEQEAG